MKLVRATVREFLDLKLTIAVALILVVYSFVALIVHASGDASGPLLSPATTLQMLVFWLMGILWLAYRRWSSIAITDRELEEIMGGITPDAFIVVSPDRQISMCSRGVEKMFGHSPSDLLGKSTEILYFDRRPTDGRDHGIHDQLDRLGFHLGNATGKHRNGAIIPLEIITGTIRGRRGAVLLLRDITRRVEAERATREKEALVEQLQQNFAKLRETEEARDNILHMIVHDMKNPLQVILGTMQLLKEEIQDGSPNTVDSYVDETLSHTRRLIDMVNSLLDVNRLESGEMPLHLGVCDLRVSAKRALASLSRIVAGRATHVYVPADPVPVTCDSEIVHRVITNLLSNAVYHTPEDTTISVSVTPGDDSARVEVTDTGLGIPKEYHERIFGKFARVDGPHETSRHLSTGLGLTFCKLAVEAHGGQIGVISEPGHGCTFWFTLPWHPVTAKAVAQSRPAAADNVPLTRQT